LLYVDGFRDFRTEENLLQLVGDRARVEAVGREVGWPDANTRKRNQRLVVDRDLDFDDTIARIVQIAEIATFIGAWLICTGRVAIGVPGGSIGSPSL